MKGPTLCGTLTTTQASAPAGVTMTLTPRAYNVQVTDAALTVNLLSSQGEAVACIHVEIGSDGVTPTVRLWDGESGLEGDPVYTRYLFLPGPA